VSTDDHVDEDACADDAAPVDAALPRRRRWIFVGFAAAVVLAGAIVFVVRGVAGDSAYRLDATGLIVTSGRAIYAGDAEELCVRNHGNDSSAVGLVLRNPGSRQVTVTAVVTGLDLYANVSANGFDAVGDPVPLPVVIPAHRTAQIDVVVRSANRSPDSDYLRSRRWMNSVDVQFRVAGVIHDQEVRLRDDGLLYLAVEDAKQINDACNGSG